MVKFIKNFSATLLVFGFVFSFCFAQVILWNLPQIGNGSFTDLIEGDNAYFLTGGSFLMPFGQCFFAGVDKTTGNLQFCHFYQDARQTWGEALAKTSDNNFVVLSDKQSSSPYYHFFRLIKANTLGESLWTKEINQPAAGPYHLASFAPDSGFILGARVWNSNCVVLVRTTKNGESLWTKKGLGHESTYLSSDIRDLKSDGEIIYLLGIGYVPVPWGGSLARTFLAKISANGTIIQKTEYLDNDLQYGHLHGEKFAFLTDSFCLIAGTRVAVNVEDSVFIFLLKTNPNQEEVWRKFYRLQNFGFIDGYVQNLWQDENAEQIIITISLIDSLGHPAIGLIATDLNGNLLQPLVSYRHPDYGPAALGDAIKTSDNCILLAGSVLNNSPFLLKIPNLGIGEENYGSNVLPPIKVFPSLVRKGQNIHIDLSGLLINNSLLFYDISGREIRKSIITSSRFQFTTSDLKPGIYFLKIKNQTSKIVVFDR